MTCIPGLQDSRSCWLISLIYDFNREFLNILNVTTADMAGTTCLVDCIPIQQNESGLTITHAHTWQHRNEF